MIRSFFPEDAYACCSLIRSCIEADPQLAPELRDEIIRSESPHAMLERSKLFYLAVYESDAGLEGIAGLDMNEIRLLCVSPDHRRRGIGRALLDHMVSMVPAVLFPDIFVYASTGAVSFYKACGFTEKGPAAFTFAGSLLPTVFMIQPTH